MLEEQEKDKSDDQNKNKNMSMNMLNKNSNNNNYNNKELELLIPGAWYVGDSPLSALQQQQYVVTYWVLRSTYTINNTTIYNLPGM